MSDISDSWFPVAPGINTSNLPPLPEIIINENPAPANSVPVPEGFDLDNPDLDDLFNNILTVTSPPIYPKEMTTTVIVPPYLEAIDLTGSIKLCMKGKHYPYETNVLKDQAIGSISLGLESGPLKIYPSPAIIEITAGGAPKINERMTISIPSPAEIEITSGGVPEIITTAPPMPDWMEQDGAAVPILGDMATTWYTGWTRPFSGNSNDQGWLVPGPWPISVTINGTEYTSAAISSNGYLLFGGTEVEAAAVATVSSPALPKLFISGRNNSMRRWHYRIEEKRVIIRGEWNVDPAGWQSVDLYMMAEITLYGVVGEEQWIEIRTGQIPSNELANGLLGLFGLAGASDWLAEGAVADRSSWLLKGNLNGDSWTLTQNKYVSSYADPGYTLVYGIGAPELGAAPATEYTGWIRELNRNLALAKINLMYLNEETWNYDDWENPFYMFGVAYYNATVSGQGWMAFDVYGNNILIYPMGSDSNPAKPKILFSGDVYHSIQRFYSQFTPKVTRFRYEGHDTEIGVAPGLSNRIIEISLIRKDADFQYIEMRLGNFVLGGNWKMTNTSYAVAQWSTPAENTSLVWRMSGDGNSLATHQGCHVRKNALPV